MPAGPIPTAVEPTKRVFISEGDNHNTRDSYVAKSTEMHNAGLRYQRATNVQGGTWLEGWPTRPVGNQSEAVFNPNAKATDQ